MIAAYLCLSAALLLPAQAAPEEAVVAGRKAVDRWWDDYPWYNDAADDVRPIDVSEPWYTRLQWKWNWKGPNWGGAGGGWSGNTILEWIAWIVILLLLGVLIYVMIRVIRARIRRHATVAGEEEEADPEAEHRRVEALPLPAAAARRLALDRPPALPGRKLPRGDPVPVQPSTRGAGQAAVHSS